MTYNVHVVQYVNGKRRDGWLGDNSELVRDKWESLKLSINDIASILPSLNGENCVISNIDITPSNSLLLKDKIASQPKGKNR